MSSAREGIVVTGATGFLGRYVLRALGEAFPSLPILALGGPGSQTATAVDLNNVESILAALERFRFDTVIHLAAQSSVAGAINAPESVWRSNVIGTINLATAIGQRNPATLVIHAGSAESYGDSFLAGLPLDERAPLRPTNAYARSKVAAEMALTDLLLPASRLVLLRLFNHTGPGQDERFVAPSFAAQIARIERRGAPGVLHVGDLSAQRDFGDVEDAAAAIVSLIRAADDLDRVSAFNVCSGVTRPIQQVVDCLCGMASQKIELQVDPARLRAGSIARAAGSYNALEKATGWTPKASFEATMARLLDYWRATT